MQIVGGAHIQLGGIHRGEDHSKYIHQYNTGEIEQIKFQCTHTQFNLPTQHIEEVQEYQSQITVGHLGKYKGYQPPNLTLQNFAFVKAEQFEKGVAPVNQGKQQHNGIADGNIKHQVGDALIAVSEAETLKTPVKIIQVHQLLNELPISYHFFPKMSTNEL